MKPVLLFAALFLTVLPLTAPAATKCREDASGNVNCIQKSGDGSAQPGAVRDKPADATQSKQHKPSVKSKDRPESGEDSRDGGGVGSRTSQSREPGMTY